MNGRPFKAITLIAIALPILTALLGFLLMGSGADKLNTPAGQSSSVQMIYGPDGVSAPQTTKAPQLGFREWILYIGVLAGVSAFFLHYLNTSLGWIASILLPLLFAWLMHEAAGMSLTFFYLPNLVFAGLLALMIQRLFYLRAIMRYRMVICSLIGAALLTLNIHLMIWLAKPETQIPSFSATFISALMIFVFVTFGLSMADMVVLRFDYRKAQSTEAEDEQEDD